MLDFINKIENEELLNRYKNILSKEEYKIFENIAEKISNEDFQYLIDFSYKATNTFDSSFLNLKKESRYEIFACKDYNDMNAFDILNFKASLIEENKQNFCNLKAYLKESELIDLFTVFEALSLEFGINAFVDKPKKNQKYNNSN